MNRILNQEQLNEIYHNHELKIKDYELNRIFQDWLDSNAWIAILEATNKGFLTRRDRQKRMITVFIALISQNIYTEKELTWENYCKMMHNINLLESKYRNQWRKMCSDFYIFASKKVSNEKVRTYLQKYNDIFLGSEIQQTQPKDSNSFLSENIYTNFPLTSKPYQIKTITCRTATAEYNRNFFIKTENEFIISLLSSFLVYLNTKTKKTQFATPFHRLFVTLFEKSLHNEVNSLNDFCESTFKEQLIYFKKLFNEHKLNPPVAFSAYSILTKFYSYLDQIHYHDKGIKLFNTISFNTEIFLSGFHQKAIIEGYEILTINDMEKVPNSDKWLVLGNNDTHIRNGMNHLLNFEEVTDKLLRNDLKEFVWNTKSNHRLGRFSQLVEFLNEMRDYYDRQNELLQIKPENYNSLFSNEALLYYYTKLKLRDDLKQSSINVIIHILRSFLNYFQDKYNIPNLIINQWQEFSVEKYQEGNPISSKDFEIIKDSFKEKWKSEEDQLLFIAYQLSMTTKLRIGEIFSLKRDCIEEINDTFGKIKYYSKTSKGKLVSEVITIEKIRLIEKAITLSNPAFEKASDNLKQHIFIGFSRVYKGKIVSLYRRYRKEFTKIITDLYKNSLIDEIYTPYNARDSHINNAFELVENGQITTLQVTTITGNSAKVAQKYYIGKKRRTRDYLEALHDVHIGESEAVGIIVEDETSLENQLPVQDGAGICSSTDCIKINEDEDSFYKCLTCRYFITSVERCSLFEEKIRNYKTRLENASSLAEQNFYKALIELYATYLAEMYDMMEEVKNG